MHRKSRASTRTAPPTLVELADRWRTLAPIEPGGAVWCAGVIVCALVVALSRATSWPIFALLDRACGEEDDREGPGAALHALPIDVEAWLSDLRAVTAHVAALPDHEPDRRALPALAALEASMSSWGSSRAFRLLTAAVQLAELDEVHALMTGHERALVNVGALDWQDRAACRAWLDDLAVRITDLGDVVADMLARPRDRRLGKASARSLASEARGSIEARIAYARAGLNVER